MPRGKQLPDDVIENLVGLVRERSFMYDAKDETHMDAQKMNNAWESIAKTLKVEGLDEFERYKKLCKVSAGHVRTSLYHAVLDKLDNTDSVTILGNAGDGKTTLLHLVCLKYSTRGYLTIEIDRPEDIDKYWDADKPVLFVCDNLIGRIVVDHDKGNSWINSDCEKLISMKVKVLFACRIELWREHEKQLKQNPIFTDTVDVRSAKLTYEDKTEMIDKHLGNKISYDAKELIVEDSNFAFPECCRFVSQSPGIDFTDEDELVQTFTNPFRFVLATLETIRSKNKPQYATLVLCLLNKRKLPTTGIVKQPNFEVVRNLYLSYRRCSVEQVYDKLLDKATELNGWMLTKTDDYYDFYHDSIFEAMCRVHGARYPEHILNFCELESVLTMFTTKQVSGSDRVCLPASCYPKLCEIVTRECVKEREYYDCETWRFVFTEMKTADILKQWQKLLSQRLSGVSQVSDISVTNPRLYDVLLLLTKLPDSELDVDEVFVCAAEHGDTETARLLIDSGVTRGGRGSGLECAAHEGHSDIVKMVLERGDLDMEDVERGLNEAVEWNRVECVREIMRVHPDIDTYTIHRLLKEAAWWDCVDCLCELMKRDIDIDTIHRLLKEAAWWDCVNCLCELIKRDIDTDTIHSLLKEAVWRCCVRTVAELVKHQAVSRDYVQTLLDTEDRELFWSWTSQSGRDETRQLLSVHLNTDT